MQLLACPVYRYVTTGAPGRPAAAATAAAAASCLCRSAEAAVTNETLARHYCHSRDTDISDPGRSPSSEVYFRN